MKDGDTEATGSQVPNPETSGDPSTPPEQWEEFEGRKFNLATKAGVDDLRKWMREFAAGHGRQSTELGNARKLLKGLETVENDHTYQTELSRLMEASEFGKAAELIATRDRKQRAQHQVEKTNDEFWSQYFDDHTEVVVGAKAVKVNRNALRKLAETELGENLYSAVSQEVALDKFFEGFKEKAPVGNGVANSAAPTTPVVQTKGRPVGGITTPVPSAASGDDDPFFKTIKEHTKKYL